jgi:hypothetical protein
LDELDALYDAVPKVPATTAAEVVVATTNVAGLTAVTTTTTAAAAATLDRIDIDSFVQLCRAIDDLFEIDTTNDNDDDDDEISPINKEVAVSTPNTDIINKDSKSTVVVSRNGWTQQLVNDVNDDGIRNSNSNSNNEEN